MKAESFSFAELKITTEDIEEILGYEPGYSPAPFPELIAHGLNLASEVSLITGGYKIFDDFFLNIQEGEIKINGTVFSPGKNVVKRLEKAQKAAIFLCTAGEGISAISKLKSAEGNELLAYVIDVIGSVTVDKAANCLLNRIGEEVAVSGYRITASFSPGYCSWSVSEQHKLFSLLAPETCNISLSDTALMKPIKSVSGITGIGRYCESTGNQCDWCNDYKCIFGKIRRNKNPKKNL